jgi:SAM-dependent methyltransferase
MKVLELGCGDGAFWAENKEKLPESVQVVLSDRSEGMLRDARRKIALDHNNFSFQSFDCHEIPFSDESFDLVVANHLLFYCDDLSKVLREIRRVLNPGGTFIASTYGAAHMKEISELVSKFDDRIVLSGHKLYEKFGRENGECILEPYFADIHWYSYEDYLTIPTPESLISYVMSCHGNQNQYIVDRYNEFRLLVQKYTEKGFRITKDAGIFISNK